MKIQIPEGEFCGECTFLNPEYGADGEAHFATCIVFRKDAFDILKEANRFFDYGMVNRYFCIKCEQCKNKEKIEVEYL